MPEEYTVELRDVVKRFVSVTAVNYVSIQIRDGEFFSLLGPSGCGKTTTLRLIAGFEIPTLGEVNIGEICLSTIVGRSEVSACSVTCFGGCGV